MTLSRIALVAFSFVSASGASALELTRDSKLPSFSIKFDKDIPFTKNGLILVNGQALSQEPLYQKKDRGAVKCVVSSSKENGTSSFYPDSIATAGESIESKALIMENYSRIQKGRLGRMVGNISEAGRAIVGSTLLLGGDVVGSIIMGGSIYGGDSSQTWALSREISLPLQNRGAVVCTKLGTEKQAPEAFTLGEIQSALAGYLRISEAPSPNESSQSGSDESSEGSH